MSTGPIPNSLIASQNVNNINTLQDQLNTVEQQVETGQQLICPGQNPTATAIVLPLQTTARQPDAVPEQPHDGPSLPTEHRFRRCRDVSTSLSQANSLLLSGLGTTSTAGRKPGSWPPRSARSFRGS